MYFYILSLNLSCFKPESFIFYLCGMVLISILALDRVLISILAPDKDYSTKSDGAHYKKAKRMSFFEEKQLWQKKTAIVLLKRQYPTEKYLIQVVNLPCRIR